MDIQLNRSIAAHLHGLLIGQLRPYLLPVVGAKVAARDYAGRCLLDGEATLRADGPVPARHLRQIRERKPKVSRQNGSIAPARFKIGFEVHIPTLAHAKLKIKPMQNMRALKL